MTQTLYERQNNHGGSDVERGQIGVDQTQPRSDQSNASQITPREGMADAPLHASGAVPIASALDAPERPYSATPVAAEFPSAGGQSGLALILAGYKEGLALTKDTLDTAWKFAPLFLCIPAAVVWTYLHKIGWGELFFESVVSIPGFVVMIVLSCLLLFALFVQFCFPSMLIGLAANLFEKKQKALRTITCLHVLPSMIWFTCIALSSECFGWQTGVTLFVALSMTLGLTVLYVLYSRKVLLPIFNREKELKWPPFFAALILSSLPTITAMGASIPLLLCLRLFDRVQLSIWASVFVFMLCALGALLSLAPGTVFLWNKVLGRRKSQVWRMTALTCLFVCFILLNFAMQVSPAPTVVLRVAGVFDEHAHVYQVLKPDLIPAMRAAGIYVAPVRPSPYNGQQATYFISAFTRFRFNNIQLLCSRPFNPEMANVATPFNPSPLQSKLRWLAGGDFCMKAYTADLRPIRR
jgi:hypothetical protein